MICYIILFQTSLGLFFNEYNFFFHFLGHVTSLSMSPTSDFLSTTHENDLGVYLWCNKSLYRHVSLKPINQSETEPIFIR